MKRIIVILCIIIACLGLISCDKGKVVKLDAIDSKDYEAFNNLFSEDRKVLIT